MTTLLSNLDFRCVPSFATSSALEGLRTQVEILGELQRVLLPVRTTTTWHQHQRKQITLDAIARLADLQSDWDGEGACEIAPSALAMATSLLASLPNSVPVPDFSPNPNGTLSLYWALPHGSAELEIGRTRHSWVLLDSRGRATQTCSGDNRAFDHEQPLLDLIRALIPVPDLPETHQLTPLVMAIRWDNELIDMF